MQSSVRVLALFAHPDDAEFLCAGTLAHLAERGATVYIVTMTPGDCGSTILPSSRISPIRRQEAKRSAAIIRAEYACLEERDLSIFYERRTIQKVMEQVRRTDPAIVFTHSPCDYMVDHETTSRICQTACFGACAPNYRTGARQPAKPTQAIPPLYYAQPLGDRDILGTEVRPAVYVNIEATRETKSRMLACHESQGAWLQAQQGLEYPTNLMLDMAKKAGTLAGFQWAEGFRQHLGHGFPQQNVLRGLLGDLVRG
jgi:LmbE family N-acetylglucosaminyl deacetylase